MSIPRTFLRIVLSITLLGFLVGTGVAAWDIFAGGSVREFQALDNSSPLMEQLGSLAHRAAIEGVGFACIGLLLALSSIFVARLLGNDPATRGERIGAGLVIASAAFFAWATFGAWLGNEALPYLGTSGIWTLNLVGFLGGLIGFTIYLLIGKLMPWAGKPRPLAAALAAIICAGVGAFVSVRLLKAAPDWRAVSALAQVGVIGILGIALVGPVARLISPLVAGLVSWWSRENPLPKKALIAVGALLVITLGFVAPKFSLSSVTGSLRYQTLQNAKTPAGPNVVLITIDTLRAKSLGTYGYERPTSPFMDALAAEGAVMLDATASASWTKPTTATLLTGLHPKRHGAQEHGSPLSTPPGMLTLAETFQEAGYVTAGFVTNPNIKAVFGFDRGFEEYFDSPVEDTVALASIRNSIVGKWLMNLSRHQFNWKYDNDVMRMNEYIFPWLDKNQASRFFLYLHYIDPHSPYSPPAEYYDMFKRDAGTALFNDRKAIVGLDLYDGEIRYTDDGIKDLVAKLKALDLWDNTVFVITSDHGEEWFEHEVLGHGFSLYQEVVGVPLIFHGPGVPAGLRIETPVQILDMPATILDLAQTGHKELGDGASFLPLFDGTLEERTLHMDSQFGMEHDESNSFIFKGLRMGQYKLVLTESNAYFPPSDPRYKHNAKALFDLKEDPNEMNNVIDDPQYEQIRTEMLDRFMAQIAFIKENGIGDTGEVELSAEMMAEMRALGYLGD